MSITVTTTRITRQYLERKTKSDLAQMYLDLLEDDIRLESVVKEAISWAHLFGYEQAPWCLAFAKLGVQR